MTELSEQEKKNRIKLAIRTGTLELNSTKNPKIGDLLRVSVVKGSYKIVKLLLKNGVDPHVWSKTYASSNAFTISIDRIETLEHVKIFNLFLEYGAQINKKVMPFGFVIFPIASLLRKYYNLPEGIVKDSLLKIITNIVKSGIDLHWDMTGFEPVEIIVKSLDIHLLKLMYKHDKYAKNVRWCNIFKYFAERIGKHVSLDLAIKLSQILEKYTTENRVDMLRIALQSSIFSGNILFIQYIIQELGNDLEQDILDDMTHTAFRYSDMDVLEFLLSRGGNPNYIGYDQRNGLLSYFSSLYTVSFEGLKETVYRRVKLFIKYGGNINSISNGANQHFNTVLKNLLTVNADSHIIKYILDNGGREKKLLLLYPKLTRGCISNYKLMLHYGAKLTSIYQIPELQIPPVVSLNRMCLNVLYDYKDELIRIGFQPLLFAWPYDLGFYDEEDGIKW